MCRVPIFLYSNAGLQIIFCQLEYVLGFLKRNPLENWNLKISKSGWEENFFNQEPLHPPTLKHHFIPAFPMTCYH